MVNDRIIKVRKRAEKIFNRYGLSIPVDFSRVLLERHIDLIYMSDPSNVDAYCVFNSDHPTIVINSDHASIERQRFSIAHEIGHICIPWHTGISTCSLENPYYCFQGQRLINTQEVEANTFASELLMPNKWVREKMTARLEVGALAEAISKEAQTSILAGFYAIDSALPIGEMFVIKTEQWDFCKPFWGTIIAPGFVSYPSLLTFLDLICEWRKSSTLRSYKIWHYKLFPFQNYEIINNLYLGCNRDFTKLLNRLSEDRPIRLVPYIDKIVESIDDPLNVVVYLKNVLYKTFRTEKATIRISCSEDQIEHELEQIESNFDDYGRIFLSRAY